MRPALFSVLLLLLPLFTGAQNSNANNVWLFGTNAGLDFNTTPPTAISGQLVAEEGSSSISDPDGNLLFYTNGMNIWDKNHNIMPNGSGLLGGFSSTQAAVILPWPSSCNKYLVLTVGDQSSIGDIRYSIVDMCLNNGLGDVDTLTKNVLLTTGMAEKLTATLHTNGTDIWVLTHKLGTNEFMAYLVTAAGINTTPVVSAVGSVHPNNKMIGPIRISHQSNKLVTACTFDVICEMFDFNPANGQITNMVNLRQLYSLPAGVYGLEFSPNDSLLYVTVIQGTSILLQLNLTTGIKTTVASMSGNYHFGGLQLGRDQKIYMARRLQNYLAVIQSPNIPGLGCQYMPSGQMLLSGTSNVLGLVFPNPYSLHTPKQQSINLGPDTAMCTSDTITMSLSRECSTSFLWQDGSVDSFLTITQPGIYWVQVSNICHVFSDTIVISVDSSVNIHLGNDTTICSNETITLDAGKPGLQYLWSTGDTTQGTIVNQAGQYWLRVTSGSCTGTDTIQINIKDPPLIHLGNDTMLCENDIITLDAGYPAAVHLWSTGDSSSSIAVENPGIYWVQVLDDNCMGSDTINILYSPLPEPVIIGDTVICGDSSVVLQVQQAMDAYLWSTGSTDSCIQVMDPGLYWVVARQGGCYGRDTINVHQLQPINLGEDLVVCQGESTVLNGPAEMDHYRWSTGDTTAQIIALAPGEYWLTVSLGQCQSSDNIEIKHLNGAVFFANSFTPNQDGLNDIFKPIGIGIGQYELRIFTRWGEQIFHSSDPERGWDGTFKGKVCMNGIYAWRAVYTTLCSDGSQQIKLGKVLLLK